MQAPQHSKQPWRESAKKAMDHNAGEGEHPQRIEGNDTAPDPKAIDRERAREGTWKASQATPG
jgi:hypothetical protein